MKKIVGVIVVFIIVSLLMVWLAPPRVVLYNSNTNGKLIIKDSQIINTLSKTIKDSKKAGDRIKTPFTNKLVISRGFIPTKTIRFAMASMFVEDEYGQIIIWGKPYRIDGSFYDVLYEIQEDRNFSLDTL